MPTPELPRRWTVMLVTALLSSCRAPHPDYRAHDLSPSDDTRAMVGEPEALVDPANVDFLLGIDFAEAAQMTNQSMVLPPLFRVAANKFERPKRPTARNKDDLIATGNVFLEINFSEPLVALAQEAEVTMRQITLRGRPVLRRGNSVIEATSRDTVFYVDPESIEIDGPHRLRRFGDRMQIPDDRSNNAFHAPARTPATLPTTPINPAQAPPPVSFDPSHVPADMTAEEIQRIISGRD